MQGLEVRIFCQLLTENESPVMQPDNVVSKSAAGRVLWGYLSSVTIAALVFVLSAMLSKATNFESATNNSVWLKAAHFAVVLVLMFVVSWIFAVGMTALPCVALSWIARTFKIRSWVFYLLAGVAFGMLAVLAYVEFFNSFHWYTDPPDEKESTWLQGLTSVGRFLLPAGATAGALFWWVAGRHYRSSDSK